MSFEGDIDWETIATHPDVSGEMGRPKYRPEPSCSEKCVRIIAHYWADRGYLVNARLKSVHNGRMYVAEIETDTVNGYPTGVVA